MRTINSAKDLEQAIQELELTRSLQGQLLKEQALITYEMLKPETLIKTTLNQITSSSYLINKIISPLFRFIGVFSSKKKSNNNFRTFFDNALGCGVRNVIDKNPTAIKLFCGFLMQYLLRKTISTFTKDDK